MKRLSRMYKLTNDIDLLSSAIKSSNFTNSHKISIKEPNSDSDPEPDGSGELPVTYLLFGWFIIAIFSHLLIYLQPTSSPTTSIPTQTPTTANPTEAPTDEVSVVKRMLNYRKRPYI